MDMNVEEIIKQAVYEVNRKYELEAIDEAEKRGYEKGRKEENIKLAKKLKGILSNEEISEISGLSLDTVQQL